MRFLWSSDHHTLHQTTPTSHILGNLTKFLFKDHNLAEIDLVAFGGDFFERMVETPNPDIVKVWDWAKETFRKARAANPNIIFIWLAGTSSHDWEQPRQFLNIAPDDLDVRYINTLCIQKFEQFNDLTIMYVPDNMGTKTPDEIWELALDTLKVNSLEKVDLIFFHGGFDFQLHPKARHHGHLLERWESITRFGIFAGHIHTPVQKGKLFTSGSFDRTRQGEEHPKGGYHVTLDKPNNVFRPTFYENKNALPYVQFKVEPDISPEQLVKSFHAFVKERRFPPHSQICIKGGSAEIVNPVVAILTKDYPLFGIKADNESNKEVLINDAPYEIDVYEGKSLTKENLEESLFPEIEATLLSKGINLQEARNILKEFL